MGQLEELKHVTGRLATAASAEEKRSALEALQVRVTVDHDRLPLDGVLRLYGASTRLERGAGGECE